MKKKFLVITIAIVMLFSVIAFGAGTCQFYDPRVAEMERRIEELEEEIRLLRLELEKINAIAELEAFVEALNRDDFSGIIWSRIPEFLRNGIKEVALANSLSEINEVVARVKYDINRLGRQWDYSKCGRFALGLLLQHAGWRRGGGGGGGGGGYSNLFGASLHLRTISDNDYWITVPTGTMFFDTYPFNVPQLECAEFQLSSQNEPLWWWFGSSDLIIEIPIETIYFTARARIVFYINYVEYNLEKIEVQERIAFYSGWATILSSDWPLPTDWLS